MDNVPKISLRAARVNANKTVKEVAEYLGLAEKTIQNYEKGATTPDWNTAKKMEILYNYPLDYIFLPDSSLKAKQPNT